MLRPLGVSFFVLTAVWDKILMSDNMTSKLGWGVHRCGLWRGIHMGWETFSKNTRFEIGVENRVKFWQDWCFRDQPLQLKFLVLYEISINREASVDFSLTRQGWGKGVWMYVSLGNLMNGSWI